MRIGVCVKPVIDSNEQPAIAAGGDTLEPGRNKYIKNPFDEYAIEAALSFKDTNKETEIISFSYCAPERLDTIRSVLAFDVDRAVLIQSEEPESGLDSYKTAQNLSGQINHNKIDLVIMGKEAIDTQNGAVGAVLASLLDWPVITNVISLEITGTGITAVRDAGKGVHETYTSNLPCVVTVTKGINTPRLPGLSGIMKSKSKPVDIVEASPGADSTSAIQFSYPPAKGDCVMLDDMDPAKNARKLSEILKRDIKI